MNQQWRQVSLKVHHEHRVFIKREVCAEFGVSSSSILQT
jgi:hypothetical protein